MFVHMLLFKLSIIFNFYSMGRVGVGARRVELKLCDYFTKAEASSFKKNFTKHNVSI